MPAVRTIKKRRDFLAVRGGRRASTAAFLLEAKSRKADAVTEGTEDHAPRIGFTVTKKLGNAVRRNRIRRRLKAAVSSVEGFRDGFDYVIVARAAAFDRPFAELVADVSFACSRVHGPAHAKNAPGPERGGGREKPSAAPKPIKKPTT